MKDSLMKKLENREGFTLAELLVVVAIIAILVATSIPIFTGSMENAENQTDLANMRAAKAAASVQQLEGKTQTPTDNSNVWYYNAKDGVLQESKAGIEPYGKGNASPNSAKGNIIQVTFEHDTSSNGTTIKVDWTQPENTTAS